MSEGIVFDIQRFSVKDGPGIRTTAFLKGCPLNCLWCHNPEGRGSLMQMRFFPGKCLRCGGCVVYTGTAPNLLAGRPAGPEEMKAAEACPGGALVVSGQSYTPEQLVAVFERDRDFYGERGGITISGGEPTMQPEFLYEVLRLCREHELHTAVDTCGYAPESVFEKIAPLCGLILYDIKCLNPELHRRFTGRDNKQILDNLRFLAAQGVPLWVRVPVIRGVNADLDSMETIAKFLVSFRQSVQRVTLMPYHSFGNAKYETLGLAATIFQEPSDEEMAELEHCFSRHGFVTER